MRLVYLLYSLLIVFPIPTTLFLDYNVIYALVQIALSPSLPTASVLARRNLVGVPTLRSSTPWWIATGLYAGCTTLWILVVCTWLGFVRGYVRHWHRGDVAITKVYQNLTSFHSASLSSFSTFSMLSRVRLAPLLRSSVLSKSVVGNRRSDWFIETCHYYRQAVVGIGFYKLFPLSSHPFRAASDSSLLDLTRTVSSDSGQPSGWRSRRDRRLRAAILLCLPRSSRSYSSLSGRHTSEFKGGHFHAKSISSPELLQAPSRPAPLGLAPQSVLVAKRDKRAGSTAGKEKENCTMHMDATQRQKMADLDYERRKLARDHAAATLSGQRPMASSPPGVRFPYVLPTPRISETPFMSREINMFSDEAVRVPLPERSPEPTTRGSQRRGASRALLAWSAPRRCWKGLREQ
ncbi:hypothetical protein MVLG_05490 [Microbotryum lychnidis-dioicae p1A1 Lamole]|uniref:Uncharacterized protein n=1 Tax=Microbotryum lychnidis-dioicae (strain p1A1 Lamole / MvSl-1064) TaxID=683840 RepID=U5HEE6_USTV1|nr:hypothetical protein MVLG_05490 [Microbotryum lychnidis-dioicae p1A1 Lamole]|eukprot:KDE04051.1 hypothetical protein MVLG_05490 [Microbotryum lychnidis-dioicae p1A1 Lamole]